jgi:hypothetical protein
VEYTAANRATATKQIYPGAYLVPALKLVAYPGKTLDDKDGVTAYINSAFFAREGVKIGGVDVAEQFSQYSGKAVNEYPTQALDDEIPF